MITTITVSRQAGAVNGQKTTDRNRGAGTNFGGLKAVEELGWWICLVEVRFGLYLGKLVSLEKESVMSKDARNEDWELTVEEKGVQSHFA